MSSTFVVSEDVWVPRLSPLKPSPPTEPDLVAALLPHAASPESLELMHQAYARFPFSEMSSTQSFTLLLISTSHAPLPKRATAGIPDFHRISFPTGETFEVNKAVCSRLMGNVTILPDKMFTQEHSWRVQMGVIRQVVDCNRVTVVPILLRKCTVSFISLIARIINTSSDIYLLCNTDLLHCGNVNGWSLCPKSPRETDIRTLCNIVKRTRRRTNRKFKSTVSQGYACGPALIELFVRLNQRMKTWRLAHQRYACCCRTDCVNSTQDLHHVGYGLITIRDPSRWRVPLYRLPRLLVERHLFAADGHALSLADAIKCASDYQFESTRPWAPSRALFVTLNEASNDKLRGCIGTFKLKPHKELPKAVLEYAWRASQEDNRFTPLTVDESFKLSYHLNLIQAPTPLSILGKDICSILQRNIVVGVHGLTLRFTNQSEATYLASVLIDNYGCLRNISMTIIQCTNILKDLRNKAHVSTDTTVSKAWRYVCEEWGEEGKIEY